MGDGAEVGLELDWKRSDVKFESGQSVVNQQVDGSIGRIGMDDHTVGEPPDRLSFLILLSVSSVMVR